MKKFILYIILFFCAVFVIDLAFGAACRYLNVHAKGGDTANHYEITMHRTDSILVLGSSRAIHHYDPKILEDSLGVTAYNCGLDANGILFQYGRLAMMMERYTPKMIIYDAIPQFDIAIKDDPAKYLAWLKRWYGHPAVDSIFNDVAAEEKFKMISNLYQYNEAFIQMLSDNVHPQQKIAYKGYKPLEGVMNYNPVLTPEEIVEWHPLKLKYFKKLISLCKTNDIKLVMVYSPWYGKKSSESYTRLTQLCKDNNIPVIDFYANGNINDSTHLFTDQSHLNIDGATKFTKVLISELRKVDGLI